MKIIIHADVDDLIFGVRAVKAALVRDRTEAVFQYGEDADAPTAYARQNPSGSWTAWVQRASKIERVEA